MAMVKASSYGSGGPEIAQSLQFNHVNYLAVAYTDEGIELRENRIALPIMVMNPERNHFDLLIKNQLEPEVYSLKILRELLNAAETTFYSDKLPIKIHLKIETGMHRLGFSENEIPQLISLIKDSKHVEIASIFSHLSVSDDKQQDEITHQQAAKLNSIYEIIIHQIGQQKKPFKHLLNSAGVSRFAQYQFDMVRLGIGLYGVGCDEYEQKKLEQVLTLKTGISQIKTVKKGDYVGYGRHAKAKKDMTIAIIPIGYADGIDRKLGNRAGEVFINGNYAPYFGNICMDMAMIDISEIEAKEGDSVIVIGKEISISKLAKTLDTIPYEILTGISRRVKRIYIQE